MSEQSILTNIKIYNFLLDRNDLQCDGSLKIRPTESKLLRSPYFYSQGGEKFKRKCVWRICPSKGWRIIANMMIVHRSFSSNRFATWWNMGKKQKPTVSVGWYYYSSCIKKSLCVFSTFWFHQACDRIRDKFIYG